MYGVHLTNHEHKRQDDSKQHSYLVEEVLL